MARACDENVLKFRVSYHATIKPKGGQDKQVQAIDTEEVLQAPARISQITSYILEHFATQTKRNDRAYTLNDRRLRGFNALFATQSIPMAMRYYAQFKAQQEALPESKRLKVGIIYSHAPNDDAQEILAEENNEDTAALPQSQRDFLDSAISDYNAMFKCDFDSCSEKFQNYYKDFSLRLKNRELDLAIVVNMFLTGFDAPTLNTLFVNKPLRYHGLLQAYSRTNRILNSVKSYGNIICFTDLQKATDESLALFSDEKASDEKVKGIVLLRSLEEYLQGYTDENGKHEGYTTLLENLRAQFPLENFAQATLTNKQKKDFLKLFGSLLKLRNILEAFDEFSDPLSARERQDYQSHYLDVYERLKSAENKEQESVLEEVEFEIELLRQVDINIDYILYLIKEHRGGCDKKFRDRIGKILDSSPSLRSKRELLLAFLERINPTSDIDEALKNFMAKTKEDALQELIVQEGLRELFERFRGFELDTKGRR